MFHVQTPKHLYFVAKGGRTTTIRTSMMRMPHLSQNWKRSQRPQPPPQFHLHRPLRRARQSDRLFVRLDAVELLHLASPAELLVGAAKVHAAHRECIRRRPEAHPDRLLRDDRRAGAAALLLQLAVHRLQLQRERRVGGAAAAASSVGALRRRRQRIGRRREPRPSARDLPRWRMRHAHIRVREWVHRMRPRLP